ncbi:hypothetical protein B0H13DRAFT_2486810 [Mycena leptocephala]|nr:hypothetical protein B0H13DRAFT_2486810 [Mycena leptocephala]
MCFSLSIGAFTILSLVLFIQPSILISTTGVLAASNTVAKPNMTHTEDLTEWFKSSAISIFPNHTSWETSYVQYFNQTLVASFGPTKYNYSSLMDFYSGANQLIAASGYSPFTVEFTSITIDANVDDAGGIAIATGLVKGYKDGAVVASDTAGLFATISIVDGERKYTEWREVNNFRLS